MKVNKRILSIGLTISLIMAGAPNINALSSIERYKGKIDMRRCQNCTEANV